MTEFSFRAAATCLGLCESIESSFETVMPELFRRYVADGLHGRPHVWSVLRWCMHISEVVLEFSPEVLSEEIDHSNLIAAALLHDTAGLTIMDGCRSDHHIRAAEYIKPILRHVQTRTPVTVDLDRVCDISRAHRLRGNTPPRTLSEEIIALADGLDESMTRLYHGNRGKRPFYDESLSIDHRLRVVARRNLPDEGVDREDSRNDTLMFMLDSLVRNSVDYNPWRLVLSPGEQHLLRISDECWRIISREYFRANYRDLVGYVQQEGVPGAMSVVSVLFDQLSQQKEFNVIHRLCADLEN